MTSAEVFYFFFIKIITMIKSKTNSHSLVQTLNLLDKCVHILRDDRIWLRNKIKSRDHTVVQIFQRNKRPHDLQTLQIELRKFINNFKQKVRQEQLQRFREELCLSNVFCDKNRESQKTTCRRDQLCTLNSNKLSTRNLNVKTVINTEQQEFISPKFSADLTKELALKLGMEKQKPAQNKEQYMYTFKYNPNVYADTIKTIQTCRALQYEYAEDIFDLLYPYMQTPMETIQFAKIVRRQLRQYSDNELMLENIKYTIIDYLELGEILDNLCKPKPNICRELLRLIDTSNKGYFTQEQYLQFIDQIFKTEQNAQMTQIAHKILEQISENHEGRISYWNLYRIKDSKELAYFIKYLEQFEFQIYN